MAALLLAASKLRRSVLPSMATTCPSVTSCNAVIQLNKHFSNSAGLMARKIALKRSWDGMPALRSRNFSRNFFFARPNSARATKSSAPQMTAHTAITRKLISGYVPSRRLGSVTSEKYSSIAADFLAGITHLLAIGDSVRRTASAKPNRACHVMPYYPESRNRPALQPTKAWGARRHEDASDGLLRSLRGIPVVPSVRPGFVADYAVLSSPAPPLKN